MIRAKVTAVDASGAYIQTAEYGVLGPCQVVGATPDVDDMVLAANVGTDVAPDLVVLSGGTPATSTDNTVPRFDGTGGALQGSGVTIDDSNTVTIPGNYLWLIPAASFARIYLAPPAGSNADIRLTTGGTGRWIIAKNAAAESGSNAGSNFAIYRQSDAGSTLSTSMVIDRASGRITFGDVGASAGLEFGGSGPRDMAGSGSPEGVVTAPIGSTWRRTNGGAGTSFYIKESGTGNTGWRAV